MKLIVWLWNPGTQYKKTRHNIGFLFLDYFKNKYELWDFKNEKKFFWDTLEWNIDWEKVLFLKPMTFMNLSGKSIKTLLSYYKIDIEDLMIIYDDKDMEFWTIRYKHESSSWWHNWIKDTIEILWTSIFSRIKIWIQNEKIKFMDASDFVLSNFSEDELSSLDTDIFIKAKDLLLRWIKNEELV